MMLLHIKKEPPTAISDSKHIITKDCTSEHNKSKLIISEVTILFKNRKESDYHGKYQTKRQ